MRCARRSRAGFSGPTRLPSGGPDRLATADAIDYSSVVDWSHPTLGVEGPLCTRTAQLLAGFFLRTAVLRAAGLAHPECAAPWSSTTAPGSARRSPLIDWRVLMLRSVKPLLLSLLTL